MMLTPSIYEFLNRVTAKVRPHATDKYRVRKFAGKWSEVIRQAEEEVHKHVERLPDDKKTAPPGDTSEAV